MLDALKLSHAHLVGESFGGTLPLLTAAYHPERIDRMVQLGYPAFVPGMKAPAFLRLLGTTSAGQWRPAYCLRRGACYSPRSCLGTARP